MEKTLKTVLEEARAKKIAVGHFNISDLAAAKAILAAATNLQLPVMIGVSEGERGFIGTRLTAAIIAQLKSESPVPVFLNADHTHSIEKALDAARAGFDEIIFDASKEPFEKNVELTRQAVIEIKSINPDIVVEGEIGFIGSSSEILETTPAGAALTAAAFSTPEEARQFVAETKVDVLAPAVGNMHGLLASMVKGEVKKHLDAPRVAQIAQATGAFLTLHGGSGTADEDFLAAIEAGITIVHVNTELRLAWRRGLEEGLSKDAHEVAPYKLLAPAVANMQELVQGRLRLFSRM